MLATYAFPNLDLSQCLSNSHSKNHDFYSFSVKPSSHSNGSPHSEAMAGDYPQTPDRLSGAYQFFRADKAMSKQEEQHHYPGNSAQGPSSELKHENPPETMTTPPCANSSSNIICLPKDLRFLLLAQDEREYESEVDEDFLDDDEEEEDDDEGCEKWDQRPESPNKLLAFASGITGDLQRYFTRNKDNEDYCDVFENKYELEKSGRELYYADLLVVAQYGEGKGKSTKDRTKPTTKTQASAANSSPSAGTTHTITSKGRLAPCLLPHRGTLNSELGLGPYQELFDSVLREPLIKDEFNSLSNHVEFPIIRYSSSSWNTKKFPPSFWDEPGSDMHRDLVQTTTSQTLDFSDLLAGW